MFKVLYDWNRGIQDFEFQSNFVSKIGKNRKINQNMGFNMDWDPY